jgi:hypothetical protein
MSCSANSPALHFHPMTPALIKVGMPVSYDYAFLYHSLPLVYEHADRITLAVDKDCRTWTGIQFAIEDSFWDWVQTIDVHKKIDVYRDDFYQPGFTAYQNQTRERNLLAQQMGPGGWHVQLDSDEYMLDFGGFAQFLRRHSRWTDSEHAPIEIRAFWIPLFRQTDDGFLYVKDTYESFSLATNRPDYKLGRLTYYSIRFAPFCAFHQTWARPEDDVWLKMNSFGAGKDFNIQSYFNLWKAIDRNNFHNLRDFHPLIPTAWSTLAWGPGKDIIEFIAHYGQQSPPTVPTHIYLRRKLGELKRNILRRCHFQKD